MHLTRTIEVAICENDFAHLLAKKNEHTPVACPEKKSFSRKKKNKKKKKNGG